MDDDLWFEPVGEDIYIVGSIPDTGLLGCLILHPGDRLEFAATPGPAVGGVGEAELTAAYPVLPRWGY